MGTENHRTIIIVSMSEAMFILLQYNTGLSKGTKTSQISLCLPWCKHSSLSETEEMEDIANSVRMVGLVSDLHRDT